MRELRDCLGHSVVVSAMTLRGALFLKTAAGTAAIAIGVRPGSELPFHASAQGKILLAHATRPRQERVLARPLQGFTAPTRVAPSTVREELLRVARLGFASAPEEAMLGIDAVAAPIFCGKDACVGALALVGSIQFLPAEPSPASISALRAASRTDLPQDRSWPGRGRGGASGAAQIGMIRGLGLRGWRTASEDRAEEHQRMRKGECR
jgi:IclR family transcriptional regulator, KDG regulon repressor